MKYRQIGNSNLNVSIVGLGTWVFGGREWGETEDAVSIQVVRGAVEKGINFIDTAPIYGNGRSEEVIGKALAEIKREAVIIATKCGLEQKGTSIRHNLSPGFIRQEIENSLKRLNVETIDLYQCHWPDPDTPIEETMQELKTLVSEGKIRYIGVSNFNQELLARALALAPVTSNQVRYSILDREIENDIIPFCERSHVSVLAYGPLGGGILTGKYKKQPHFSKGDVRSFFYKYYREPVWSKVKELIMVLAEISEKHKVPVSQIAIDWVLNKKVVASCLTGCRSLAQLEKNIGASEINLSEDEIALIEKEYKRLFL
ncbi:MAG: aldo/keto reductase [Candidatus Omnitrophota bacterium]